MTDNIIGLDVSIKSTGLYILQTGHSEIIQRNFYKNAIERVCRNYPGCTFIIENYAFAANGQRLLQQAELIGRIKHVIEQMQCKFVMMPIPTWKKYAQIKCKKGTKKLNAEYLKIVLDIHGKVFNTTDEADAYFLCLAYVKEGLK